jgi:hypothetical protein
MSVLSFNILQAQYLFNKVNNIPVADTNNIAFKYPWAGGLNNPQFSEADLNNDGIKDLVVLNRSNITNGDRLLTFINNGTTGQVDYQYAPEYQDNFPYLETDSPKIAFWMRMADYNCDGIDDIFASTPGYIQLYEGSYDNNNKIAFQYKTYLQYNAIIGLQNIFVSSVDIPAITDVNGDGDIDVLCFNTFGYTMEYYENQSMELTATCGDTVVYALVDDCWGNIYENGLTRSVVVRDTCGTIIVPKNSRHPGGSTILAFDINADNVKDVLLGGASYYNMNMLINGGNADTSKIIAQDTLFPWYNITASMPMLPAGFYLDINNDNNEDLIISPNSPKRSENYYCSWLYENISPTAHDTFLLTERNFLVSDMIDVGEGAHPVFADFNQDGLTDFMLGNTGYYYNGITEIGALALFQNVGTSQSPAFKFKSNDAFSLSALGLTAMAPALADMDSDGDLDMFIGETDGEINYFTNIAGQGNPSNFTLTESSYKSIDVGQFSIPTVFDVNADGLKDLVIGERDGNLNYYRNIGTATVPNFDSTPDNSFFGKVNVRATAQVTGFSAPAFSTLDSTGQIYLLVGSESGGIKVYEFNPDSVNNGAFKKISDRFSAIYEGERNTPALADLNNDGKMEMLVGNYSGGLCYFSQTDSIASSVANKQNADNSFLIYPNPANNNFAVRFQQNLSINGSLKVYNVLGHEIYVGNVSNAPSGTTVNINAANWDKGIYFIQFNSDNSSETKKLLIN